MVIVHCTYATRFPSLPSSSCYVGFPHSVPHFILSSMIDAIVKVHNPQSIVLTRFPKYIEVVGCQQNSLSTTVRRFCTALTRRVRFWFRGNVGDWWLDWIDKVADARTGCPQQLVNGMLFFDQLTNQKTPTLLYLLKDIYIGVLNFLFFILWQITLLFLIPLKKHILIS